MAPQLTAPERREKILQILNASHKAISASALASALGVSRQIIVGDVALIRASGGDITATPRGYILNDENNPAYDFAYEGTIACKHSKEQLKDELYTIVDFGGTVMDVTVEHSLYGQLLGQLNLSSRYDVDLFLDNLEKNKNQPLCSLTGGIHLHKIGCKDKSMFELIKSELTEKGIALE